MVCFYLFFEYVRPQSIYPVLNFLPWTQISIIGAVIGYIFGREKGWVSSPVNKLLVLWFCLIYVSSIYSYNPDLSFSLFKNFYSWIIIYFIIVNLITTRKRFLIFLFIFLLAGFKLSLSLALTWAQRGFSFTMWGLMGPPGFFQNSGELAIQMLVFWPIAHAVAISLKPCLSRWKYYVLLAMPITAIMVILGASSRGGQLAMLIQIAAKNVKFIFRLRILISIFVGLSAIWYFMPDEQKRRFENIGNDVSSQQRILYWENGMEMIQQHPWFGVGYYNYIPYYEKYYSEDMLYSHAELPHNIFIQVGAELGIPALLVYMLMIVYAFYKTSSLVRLLSSDKENLLFFNLARALNISLIGFVVAGQFVSVVYYPFMWIHLALVVSLNHIFLERTRSSSSESREVRVTGSSQSYEDRAHLGR